MILKSCDMTGSMGIHHYNYVIIRDWGRKFYFNLNGPIRVARSGIVKCYMDDTKSFPMSSNFRWWYDPVDIKFAIKIILYMRR